MKKMIRTSLMILAVTTSLTSALCQQPAQALVADSRLVDELQVQRTDLLNQESRLLRDQDDLNRQIDLQKKLNDPQKRYLLNDLLARRDRVFFQIRQTRSDLSQVEQELM